MIKIRHLLELSIIGAVLASCSGAVTANPEPAAPEPIVPGQGEYAVGAPLKVRDGKVRFYVETAENGAAELFGLDLTDAEVTIGNRSYPVENVDGYSFVDVEQTSTGAYSAVLTTSYSADYTGESSHYTDLTIPYSQFAHKSAELAAALPRYAQYSAETGNRLIFSYSAALLTVRVKGSAKISSVKAEASGCLAGKGWFAPSKGEFGIERGKNFVTLNATASGESTSGTEFRLFVAPGKYAEGIDVTACDSEHLMCRRHFDVVTLSPDEHKVLEMDWTPDEDLLFYDGFDNFVWGGDIISGSGSFGCRPDAGEVGESTGQNLSGYEAALTEVDCSVAGAGAVQPDSWAAVSGLTVGYSHVMSESYITSRNIGDYELMFRVQEFPGYIGVGTVNASGGMFKAPLTSRIKGNEDVKVSFDWCPAVGFADNLMIKVVFGGRVKALEIDGEKIGPYKDKSGYLKSTYDFAVPTDAVEIPSSAASAKKWHHVDAYIENVNTSSSIILTTSDNSATGKNGFYLDNFEMRKVRDAERGRLRVLYWNIQDGMWADQHNGYDNFVEWVKRYDPDVCVWCESETVFKDKTTETMPGKDRYLPNGWGSLSARYGHAYTSISGDRDSYPQTITSCYPIETLRQVTDTENSGKPIVHGAGLFSVTVGGKKVNFISVHTWPQTYGYKVPEADRPASTAAHEGDIYRQYEMGWICENLYNDPQYSSTRDVLMLGDFNSYSPLDNHFYSLPESDTKFLCQKEIFNRTDLVEVVGTKYPGEFYSSVMGDGSRVDMAYASPSLYSSLSNVQILIDDWCRPEQCPYVTGWIGLPSDHKPILLDFNY